MTTADLWHRYGRTRAQRDRAVPETFYWVRGQGRGPGWNFSAICLVGAASAVVTDEEGRILPSARTIEAGFWFLL
ncbi:hypothetical protein ACWDSL_15490 [Streptomyces sp. NPDC000941]